MRKWYSMMPDGTTAIFPCDEDMTEEEIAQAKAEGCYEAQYNPKSIYHPKNRAKAIAEGKLPPNIEEILN